MKYVIVALGIVTFMGTVVRADFTRGSQTVSLFGGYAGSSNEYDYRPGNWRPVTGAGGAFGGQYLYYVSGSPAIAIGADLASSPNGSRRSGDLINGYESTARVKSFVGMIVARLAFPRGAWRPYIFGGAGAHDSSQQLSAQPQPGNSWLGGGTDSRMLVDQHKTSAAVGCGIGMDVFPKDSFFIGAELRRVWLAGLDTDDTAALRAAGFTVDQKQLISEGYILLRAGLKF